MLWFYIPSSLAAVSAIFPVCSVRYLSGLYPTPLKPTQGLSGPPDGRAKLILRRILENAGKNIEAAVHLGSIETEDPGHQRIHIHVLEGLEGCTQIARWGPRFAAIRGC